MRNSLTVATLGTIGGLLVAVPAGWAVSRNVKIGWSLYAVIATYMLPPVALAVPLYRGLAAVGLLNTVYGLALVYLTILAPFTTWLLKSGFDSIPQEIEHAAMIDGARLDQIIRLIMLPLAAPVVATTALFAFLLAWDEFFYALLFTSDQRAKTLTVAIADLAGGRIADYGLIAAAGVMAALPPVLIGLVMQRASGVRPDTGWSEGMTDQGAAPKGAGLTAIEMEMARQGGGCRQLIRCDARSG